MEMNDMEIDTSIMNIIQCAVDEAQQKIYKELGIKTDINVEYNTTKRKIGKMKLSRNDSWKEFIGTCLIRKVKEEDINNYLKTKTYLTDDEEKKIRESVESILLELGRKDVVKSIEDEIDKMEKNQRQRGLDNFLMVKDYLERLHNVTK